VPYDGNDPDYVDLYLPFDADDNYKHPVNPPVAWRDHWMKRMIDLIDHYEIDFLYFDGGVPFQGEDDGLSGRKILAHLYNRSIERYGSLQAVQTIKGYADHGIFREGIAVEDIERGRMEGKSDLYWQTDDSMGPWFYAKDQQYRPVVDIVHELVDIVSKNGNLLLNVPLFPDGTLDQAGVDFLLQLGAWFDLYGEAIYGTRPYSIYGEGPTAISGGHFQEKHNPALTSQDARYTVKGDTTYIFLMGWPDSPVHLTGFTPARDAVFNVLGTEETADWDYSEEDGLLITIPESIQVDPDSPMSYTCVMEVVN
jgi:alpha-L-fucosidase